MRAAAAAVALVAGALGAAPAAAAQADCAADRVTLGPDGARVSYAVEIADDPEERARGLMFRREMARDAGMLFLYEAPQPMSFWMKNTFIPLDIVFLDAAGVVLNVAAGTTPFSEAPIPSDGPALAVLEVNAGEAARHGIVPGTQAVHPYWDANTDAFDCR